MDLTFDLEVQLVAVDVSSANWTLKEKRGIKTVPSFSPLTLTLCAFETQWGFVKTTSVLKNAS